MAIYTEYQRIELIQNEKAFQKMRRNQIDVMCKVIAFFHYSRIAILIWIIFLIIFA